MIRDHFFPRLIPYCSRPAVRPLAVPSPDLPTLRAFVPMLQQLSVDSPRHFMAGRHPGRPGSELPFQDAGSMSDSADVDS
jgi:hypothetical protein